jgi:dTDP-4-dehydrorhamnose 3,5-epimerase
MKFTELAIAGVWVGEPEVRADERGFFARTVCAEEFSKQGLPANYCQSSISYNHRRGTLRGLHYQAAPSLEQKLVRCTQGVIYDVVVDLRPASPTFKRWVAAELSAVNRLALAVPHGCAHGFITLADGSEVLYMMSEAQNAALATGVRWDDPQFSISWPLQPVVISERDARYPDFSGVAAAK